MTDTDREQTLRLAWAAGFVDGEGCITVQDTSHVKDMYRQYQALLDVAQTKTPPLEVLVALFGGRVRPYRHAFYWRLYNAKATPALQALLPYLVVKRQQAELLLEFNALIGRQGRPRSEAVVARQAEICALFRVLNARRVVDHRAERLSEQAPEGAVLRVVR